MLHKTGVKFCLRSPWERLHVHNGLESRQFVFKREVEHSYRKGIRMGTRKDNRKFEANMNELAPKTQRSVMDTESGNRSLIL